jgi:hypothetical protein
LYSNRGIINVVDNLIYQVIARGKAVEHIGAITKTMQNALQKKYGNTRVKSNIYYYANKNTDIQFKRSKQILMLSYTDKDTYKVLRDIRKRIREEALEGSAEGL